VVLDSNQRFVGIVTMEDLIEEFLGEIQDEQDIGEIPPIVKSPDGRFEADGRLTLDVAARELGLQLTPRHRRSRPWAPSWRPSWPDRPCPATSSRPADTG
jgi:CBS domain containing-hemolysin-like protein